MYYWKLHLTVIAVLKLNHFIKLLPIESNFSKETSSFLPTPNGIVFVFLMFRNELKFLEMIKFPPETTTFPVEENV